MGRRTAGLRGISPIADVRSTIILAAALVAVTPAARAQYFGQNKVQYRHLDFSVIQTDHFDVYYYDEKRSAAIDGARMAERAYARLSRVLNHRYRERQPLILFASHSEFQQNNVTNIGEGTGGVTEPFRHRVLLPFTGSYADFEHVLRHEIVHQFQFDIFARGRVGAGIQRLISVNPPLWFMEGMAEYLSLGPINAQTAMWLRDAAIEGGLPDLDELTWDRRFSPYRFGHALWSYVGERWGDEAIGEILHTASISGVDAAFRRVLGIAPEEVIEEWHDAVQRTYLPQIADLQKARNIARPLLNRRRSNGTLHISPAISPDGRDIAYLSEGNSFFIDLYLADAETGRVKRRLIKSAFSSDFESLRFLNSAGSWSPDGRLFAIAVKRGGADDLVIFDIARNRVHRRIRIPLSGLTTPSWSPDGRQLVFTGYEGGHSDLFLVNADGTDLRRLTNDKYADLHPVWSPDGVTIAFATDRGPTTDLDRLRIGPLNVALFDLSDQRIEVLPGMSGNNINPQWSPDGRGIAFVSDRTGITNVFLYELDEQVTYQLTNVYTGISGITPLSPTISWAQQADRLVFTYYEKREFNIYAVDSPRSLKSGPYDRAAPVPVITSLTEAGPPVALGTAMAASNSGGAPRSGHVPAVSYYRTPEGFRRSATVPQLPEPAAHANTVRGLLDRALASVPDSSEFTFRDYRGTLSPDYIVQPSVGYVRDNFGSGIFGGSSISLSDMLGNKRLLLAGQINGRLEEAQFLGVFADLSRRTNWAAGFSQNPLFFFSGSEIRTDSLGNPELSTRLERFVVRQLFAEALHPFDRFRRVELRARVVNVTRAAIDFVQFFDPTEQAYFLDRREEELESSNYVQPSIALVFDNSIPLWVGPFIGRRNRLEYAPAIGNWRFHQILADYRRYDHLGGPFTIASRLLFFGRFGRDDAQFPLFLGTPELLRGYTAGSLRDNECRGDDGRSPSDCDALDQLIGSRLTVVNAELRFPLLRNIGLGFAPIGFPPVEGAVFFDAGIAWNQGSTLVLKRTSTASKSQVRKPLLSMGISLRANVLGFMILRADYATPLSRDAVGSYWTLSLGPTF